jgi:tetratricopeptide (TPR) repeat protein
VRGALVFAVLFAAVAARADDDRVTRARSHFEAGRALYSLGNYGDALREFTAGYQLVERPEFLLNIGQTFRRLGDLEKARANYVEFLARAPAADPMRTQAQEILVELEREIASRPAAPPPRAPPSEPPRANVVAPPAPAPAVAKRPSAARHLAWIVPLVVVLAAGAAVAIVLAAQPHVDCGGLGCVDATSLH